jgi:hypothetical protein
VISTAIGFSDIFWRNDTGQISESLGQSNGGFAGNPAVSASVSNDLQVAGVGDFNGDGRADILWRNTDGTITNWLGQADGGFTDNSAVASQPVSTDLQIAGVGDFNGDGRADVLFQFPDGMLQAWVGGTDGAILSPTEQLWRDAIANASAFVDDVQAHVVAAPSGSGGPNLTGYAPIFGPNYPNVTDTDFMVSSDYSIELENDFSFNMISSDDQGFSVTFDNIFGSISSLDPDAGSYQFNLNGIDLIGSWTVGPPPDSLLSPDSIVITGQHVVDPTAPITGFFEFNPAVSGFNFNDGYGGGVAGLAHYETLGVSAAANAFATLHVHNLGATLADKHAYELAHDALANLFDFAKMNPYELIDVGDGVWIATSLAVKELANVQINITDESPRVDPRVCRLHWSDNNTQSAKY